jgi:hypothetical protein
MEVKHYVVMPAFHPLPSRERGLKARANWLKNNLG